VRSALTWWRGCGWLAGDPTARWPRPKIPVDTTRALTRDQVAALWRLDVPLRDKTLWRLLYETAARAEEILGLDVGDLELPGKRARVIAKGGMTEWVHWQTGAALLLPRLLAGRRCGPVFLASRKPARAVATTDLCPVTGRARLSYRRAAELFEISTRHLALTWCMPRDAVPAARVAAGCRRAGGRHAGDLGGLSRPGLWPGSAAPGPHRRGRAVTLRWSYGGRAGPVQQIALQRVAHPAFKVPG
jgi:integrase